MGNSLFVILNGTMIYISVVLFFVNIVYVLESIRDNKKVNYYLTYALGVLLGFTYMMHVMIFMS